MKITIIAVGKIKESWLKAGIAEYSKRISRFCDLEIFEIADSPEYITVDKAISAEGEKILNKIKENDFVIALDLDGEQMSSEKFSEKMIRWIEEGQSKIVFTIAGSNGYMPDLLKRANTRISLSELTFPHQMTRLIFLEQIFRAFKIQKNEKYHK